MNDTPAILRGAMTWDDRYRSGDYPAEPDPLVVRFVSPLPPGRALDLACGAGRHARWLAERGWEVTAVDNSREALALFPSARFMDLEVDRLPFADASFDLVLIVRFLHRPLFAEARRIVRPGGMVIATARTAGRFAVAPGELRAAFEGMQVLHEGKGEIVAVYGA